MLLKIEVHEAIEIRACPDEKEEYARVANVKFQENHLLLGIDHGRYLVLIQYDRENTRHRYKIPPFQPPTRLTCRCRATKSRSLPNRDRVRYRLDKLLLLPDTLYRYVPIIRPGKHDGESSNPGGFSTVRHIFHK